ncbi:hypothetical protein E2C01_036422 [Portunus trituberculatus]|uniref:Uncharacterized protein n=1 Tax=Portunus trituberculatus TaxID=210409 RepID=A0A5B7F6P1_PORTR|nr:hypothetical protein [Portunus trituberculatus]
MNRPDTGQTRREAGTSTRLMVCRRRAGHDGTRVGAGGYRAPGSSTRASLVSGVAPLHSPPLTAPHLFI